VFSDQTLDNLAAADPETARDIANSFNHWDDIDVISRDTSRAVATVLRHWPQAPAQHPQARARRWASSWCTTRMYG
jgi:hypothetical protein